MFGFKKNLQSDPIRPWFEALEAGGEFVGIRFGRIAPSSVEPEWMYLTHRDYDGIGGFAHLLRERGAVVEDLPKITHPGNLSWWPFILFLPTMLAPRRFLKWRDLKQGGKHEDASLPPPAVAFQVFDEAKTAMIRRASRGAGVTVNSFLMKYLDRAIRPSLSDPACATPWMVPVNLRGKVTQPSDTGNHSSYVGIQIYASEGAREIQKRIYNALRKREHFAVWKGFAATQNTSAETKKRLINATRATSQWSVGGFSNLGEWDCGNDIAAEDCQGDWLFAPPVLRFQMIGAGCVTFKGRLTLTLQVHPELTTSPEVASEWLRSWVREIELGLPDRALK
jgi:hypothetical protein